MMHKRNQMQKQFFMEQERLWVLLARKLAREATDRELAELEMWLQDNPQLHYPVTVLVRMWDKGETGERGDARVQKQ
jgi:hypothetical protein